MRVRLSGEATARRREARSSLLARARLRQRTKDTQGALADARRAVELAEGDEAEEARALLRELE